MAFFVDYHHLVFKRKFRSRCFGLSAAHVIINILAFLDLSLISPNQGRIFDLTGQGDVSPKHSYWHYCHDVYGLSGTIAMPAFLMPHPLGSIVNDWRATRFSAHIAPSRNHKGHCINSVRPEPIQSPRHPNLALTHSKLTSSTGTLLLRLGHRVACFTLHYIAISCSSRGNNSFYSPPNHSG